MVIMSVTTNIEKISWDKAWQEIRALLPNATHCTPASLMQAAEKANVRVTVMDAQEFPLEESDPFLIRKLLAGAKENELVITVTDCSFRDGWTPFAFRLVDVETFAAAYRRLTDECVISGLDVVLLCPTSKFIAVYYHEGQVATIGR